MVATSMPLGPFLIEEGGRLAFRKAESEPAFTFQWRGRRFSVRLLKKRLAFVAPVGRVPSTSAGIQRRRAALDLLGDLRPCLPPGWAVRLLPDHRIQLETDQPLEWPATVAALLTPIIALLMRAAPILDLLDAEGLA